MTELQEIRQAFAVEGEELLAEVERALLLLETHPGNAEEFNRLFRGIHTLKGSAGIVGYLYLEQFCHDVESLLDRIREHELGLSPSLVNLLLKCHDHIRNMTYGYLDCGDGEYMPAAIHYQLLESLKSLRFLPSQTVSSVVAAELPSRAPLQAAVVSPDPAPVDSPPEDKSLDEIPAKDRFFSDMDILSSAHENSPTLSLDPTALQPDSESSGSGPVVAGVDMAKRLPLTDSAIDVFMVVVAETRYIIPMEFVLEILEPGAGEQKKLQSRGYVTLRESMLPCISLRSIFNHTLDSESEGRFIIVVTHASGRIGLVVDNLLGETKAVIRPLGLFYKDVRYVSGTAVLSDGSIALLLETETLAQKL